MNKKHISLFLVLVLAICCMLGGSLVNAASKERSGKTKPLDLIIVFDRSSSMRTSDPKKLTSAAVRMLVNMMPAEDGRVGVITFDTEPEILTTVGDKASLIPLADIGNVDSIKSKVNAVTCKGGTGVGNALLAATNILSEQSDDKHQKAIILFTDGSDYFGKNANAELDLAKCQENEVTATLWAKKNDCPIYCFGYDYRTANGVSSMGENGEGLKKLTSISETTGGGFTRIQDINTVQEEFIRILAELCDLIYVNVDTIPGDGGAHEVTFEVNPSVIEANIRIGSVTENAIRKGKISLYDPSGKQIELANKGNVRFDVDSLAASIKVMRPKLGTWTLVLDGIVGDDVKIGLLQHYRVGIDASVEVPSGNPDGAAFLNDTVRISAWFVEDGAKLENPNLYDIVTNATATYIPRANPQNGKTIKLNKVGLSFVGSFTIEEECVYDVLIRLESGSFYRECSFVIKSTNQPVELVSNIGKVDVNLGKTVTVDNIYSHVRDLENDPISAEVSVGNPDAADVSIGGNTLSVSAKQWKSTFATVTYKDAQGNTVETTFDIRIHNPMFFIIMGIIIFLIAVVVAILIVLAYLASLKIKGYATILSLRKVDLSSDDVIDNIYSNDYLDDEVFDEDQMTEEDFVCRLNLYGLFGRKKDLSVVASKFVESYEEYLRNNNPDLVNEKENPITECIDAYFTDLQYFGVIGTPGGLKGFKIRIPKKGNLYMSGYRNRKGKVKIGPTPRKVSFIFELNEDSDKRLAYEFTFKYTR